MKPVEDIVACVADYGTLGICLAEKLAETCRKVYFSSPCQSEYQSIDECVKGDGIPGVERLDEPLTPETVNEVDLWLFPDIGFAGLQRYLRDIGKAVWGSFDATELELYRTDFLKVTKELGLPIIPYVRIQGVTALSDHLKTVKNKWVKVNRYRCFDNETEILTESGWRLFEDLRPTDKVATMNVETRKLEYRIPQAHTRNWFDGKMTRIKSRRMDALVTPDHCLWSKSGLTMKQWKYRPVFELRARGGQTTIPQSFIHEGEEISTFTIQNANEDFRHKDRPMNSPHTHAADDWLEFLGWFVSEGSLSLAGPNRNKYRIQIAQSRHVHPQKHRAILKCLTALGYTIQTEGEGGFSLYNKSLFFELANTCYEKKPCLHCGKQRCSHTKRVPEYLRHLTPRQIRIFLESYRLGDGTIDRETARYFTSSGGLADDIQELIFLSGSTASIRKRPARENVFIKGRRVKRTAPSFVISELQKRNIKLYPSNFSDQNYCGYVYDVSVAPHHSIFVRRNGLAFWSGNCQQETFYHEDYPHSISTLDRLAVKFGGLKEYVIFVVQDAMPDAQEIGYDGLTVEGWYPKKSFQGYEKKNQAYSGSCLEWDELPEEVRIVNETIAPLLREYGYRNFIATEIRKTADTFYFIDPTLRMPGQTGEQLLETCKNLAEVIWHGANGEPVEPEYVAKFACELTLHHKGHVDDEWYALNVPDSVKRWVKLYHYCRADSLYHFPPNTCDEPGVVVGIGDTIKEAIDHVKETLEALKSEPVDADISAFADLLKEISTAEEGGMRFTEQAIPEPSVVLE